MCCGGCIDCVDGDTTVGMGMVGSGNVGVGIVVGGGADTMVMVDCFITSPTAPSCEKYQATIRYVPGPGTCVDACAIQPYVAVGGPTACLPRLVPGSFGQISHGFVLIGAFIGVMPHAKFGSALSTPIKQWNSCPYMGCAGSVPIELTVTAFACGARMRIPIHKLIHKTLEKKLCTMIDMIDRIRVYVYYNKEWIILALIYAALLWYPYPIIVSGHFLLNPYIKTRLLAVALFFLVIRGFIREDQRSLVLFMFIGAIILASTLSFAAIVLITAAFLLALRVAKRI